MFVGIGVGIGRQRFASGIFSAYNLRVVADGGVTEAGACVDAVSTLLQTASLLLVPSGYKSGKAYAQIPTNGNGDLTWGRASTANRTNGSGNIELMATDVPRLSYMYGSCPALLLEPQRTNLLQRSEEFDNAYWSKYLGTISSNVAISPDGNTTADLIYPSISGPLAGQLFRNISTGISSGNVITVSAFVKASGKNFAYIAEIQNSFNPAAYFNLTTGAITNIISGVTASMTQLTNSWWRISVTSTAGAGLYYAVIGSTDSAGSNVNTASGTNGILVWGAQLEVGAYSTTYIPTTTASVTRIADTFTRNNIYTNNLITSSGGTWFVELRNNIVYTRDSATSGLRISDQLAPSLGGGAIGNTLAIIRTSASSVRLQIVKQESLTFTSLFTTTTDITKIAIKWNGTTADVFVNGIKVVSATAFAATLLQNLDCNPTDVPRFIQQMALYPTPLSDTDCTTLTTL
jgi:hypothetical protein